MKTCQIHNATEDPHVRPEKSPRTLRNFKSFNSAQFCKESSGLLAVTDVPLDLYLNVFNSTLGKILDIHAPFKTFNTTNRQNKSFFNNELRNAKRIRSNLNLNGVRTKHRLIMSYTKLKQ